MTAPLCDMWLGRCGNPADRVIEVYVLTGKTWTLLPFLVCAEGGCRQAASWHIEAFGLRFFSTRRLTAADVAAYTAEAVAA
jgi:hypothetical protein